jgi:hypothetical protein
MPPAPSVPRTRDAITPAYGHNRPALDVAPAPDLFVGPLSPELVLVSPPEVRRLARGLHIPPPPAARPLPRAAVELGSVELAAVWLFCIAMTLGPMLFMLIAST